MDPMLIWGLSLLGAAVLLIVVEMFVPSGGVIAVTAGVVGLAGVVCLFRMDQNGPLWGTAGILSLLILFPSSFFVWAKILPSTPVGRALIGEVAEETKREREDAEDSARQAFEALVGLHGTAVTDLRPVGIIEIDGDRHDALAEGVAIEAGQPVRVTSARANQLRVRPA
ncbi:MAG: NfeD family protein [Planctomycetota bacterium]